MRTRTTFRVYHMTYVASRTTVGAYVTQLMLLSHDRTIYVVRNITYDVMSLIATYVRYLCLQHNIIC